MWLLFKQCLHKKQYHSWHHSSLVLSYRTTEPSSPGFETKKDFQGYYGLCFFNITAERNNFGLGDFNDAYMTLSRTMKVNVFWDVAPRSLVGIYRSFKGSYHFHHQDDKTS
jgi:hypothetical protein